MRDGIIKSFSFFLFLVFVGSGFATTVGAQTDSSGELGYASGRSVQQTSDGGYIITGGTVPLNSRKSDVFLIKTDSNGEQKWSRTFDGPNDDEGYSVQQTSDGGYIITGGTKVSDPTANEGIINRVLLIKTDSNGKTLWSRTLGEPNEATGYSVQQTSDDGYIIVGDVGYLHAFPESKYDALLIKTDSNGKPLWSRTFGGEHSNDKGYSVQQTSDGGYIITGEAPHSTHNSYSDVWLIKTDSNGKPLWSRTFGGEFFDDVGYSVQQTSDGGYIITGEIRSESSTNPPDLWLIKTDSNGEQQWFQTFGGAGNDVGYSVQQTSDGGYIITGETPPLSSSTSDVWLIKTDSGGKTLWSQMLGGAGNDVGYSVQQTSDGGYIITGETRPSSTSEFSFTWLLKTDSNGNRLWFNTFGGSDDLDIYAAW